jgi:hypothetical protein
MVENPNFAVIVANTKNSYIAGHKELYKIIGADNLNGIALRNVLLLAGFKDTDFIHKESGRPRGKWDLFRNLFVLLNMDFEPFEHVAKMRQEDSHKIGKLQIPESYYPDMFKNDIQTVASALKQLKMHLEIQIKTRAKST